MTKNEKVALETSIKLMDCVSAIFSILSSNSNLMRIHLPTLSSDDKKELLNESKNLRSLAKNAMRNRKRLKTFLENAE